MPSSSVTLAHHWLITTRGGEHVLEELMAPFPDAPLLTLFSDTTKLSSAIQAHQIQNSAIQLTPQIIRNHFRHLLPFFPAALQSLHIPQGTKLLISSDASLIKAIPNPDHIPHICYCHSPPRYLWGLKDAYTGEHSSLGLTSRILLNGLAPYLCRVDYAGAQSVTHFVANSKFVQKRIKTHYGRESHIIHPFVAVDEFTPKGVDDGYYLALSNLAPYKRIDIAVEAFNQTKLPLVIIGAGPQQKKLQESAHSNIRFLGHQPRHKVIEYVQHCRSLIFPGIEDFGITPLEAQSAGKPVIAYRGGGVLETVIEGETGIFFDHQTAESLASSLQRFEAGKHSIHPASCRKNAERFRPSVFRREWLDFLNMNYPEIMRHTS